MTIVDVRSAMVTTIRTAIPALLECTPHGGGIDAEVIQRVGPKAPCVLVACMSAPKVGKRGGTTDVELRWGAFVITVDRPQASRDTQALTVLEALLTIMPEQRWGRTDVGPVKELRADNLFSGKLESMGAAVWGVSWRQTVDIGAVNFASLDDFLTHVARWDLAPADAVIDATDQVELEGP